MLVVLVKTLKQNNNCSCCFGRNPGNKASRFKTETTLLSKHVGKAETLLKDAI